MKVAVVIAAYDEAGNIGPLTERLVQTLDSLPEASWKLIYVVEGTDGTVEIARRLLDRELGLKCFMARNPADWDGPFGAALTQFLVTPILSSPWMLISIINRKRFRVCWRACARAMPTS